MAVKKQQETAMQCSSGGSSAEESCDTVKSPVADRRPWNLGETRHNGFEGADLNIPEATNSPLHHRSWWFVMSTNSKAAVTLCGV